MKKIYIYTRLVFLLILVLITNTVKAQHIRISLNQKIYNATYVFEGEVSNSKSYFDDTKGMVYTSHLVKISKLFKGNISGDVVEIITLGGVADGIGIDISHNLTLQKGWEGVFFCHPTVRPSAQESDASLALKVYSGEQGFIKYQEIGSRLMAITIFDRYDNIENDLLQTIVQKTGRNERLNPNQRESAFLEKIKNSSFIQRSSASMKYGIEYEFVEPELTGVNSNFLEFDIEVSTFGGIFNFGNAAIYLDYDMNAFGANIVASGSITANKETVILSADYAFSLSDETSSKLKIDINSLPNPQSPFSLSSTKEKLCHIKLDISNLLNNSPNIFFDENLMQGESEYFLNGSFYDFFSVIASDDLAMNWSLLMPPEIDTIIPDIIAAGVFDTLYIKGKNFGSTKGKVYFTDAGEDALSFALDVQADDIDVNWTDTLIKVMVTTYSDTKVPGSGAFAIQKAITNQIESSFILITYAIQNYRDSINNQAILPIIIDNASNNSFEFQLHQGVSLTSDTAEVIRQTLKQWRCKTGIDWKLSSTPTSSSSYFDNISSISFSDDTSVIDANTLAFVIKYRQQLTPSSLYFNYCHSNGNRYYFIKEIDVFFNSRLSEDWLVTTDPNITDTTKNDLWTVALHELGHGHLLNHTNYDTLNNLYPVNYNSIYIRELDSINTVGGNWIMDSIEVHSSNCGGILLRDFNNCVSSITESDTKEASYFNVYPNPFNEYLTIEFEHTESLENCIVTIVDATGRSRVLLKDTVDLGINSWEIKNTSRLSTGFYVLKFEVGNSIYYKKLIKI